MKLLIVTPHFPPINAPDHQRVRMALPYLTQLGWDITLLCVHPDDVEGVVEPELVSTLPPNLRIERVRAIPVSMAKLIGMRTLGWRSYLALKKRGSKLIQESDFDLVYFSSTTFFSFLLGPLWNKKFNIPYVLDYQDPWMNTYYDQQQVTPPGGWAKFRMSQAIAKWGEPKVIAQVSALTSVSSRYIDMLRKNYPHLEQNSCHLLPFGAAEYDFECLSTLPKERAVMFDPAYQTDMSSPKRHFVYAGRIGPDMHASLEVFFEALSQAIERTPHLIDEIQLWFIGTTYAPADRATPKVIPLAQKFNVDSLVTEIPTRIPYFSALQSLRHAHGTLLFGSDDHSYSPSKVYPSVLAGRPLLGVFPTSGEVAPLIREATEGRVVILDELSDQTERVETLCGQLTSFLESSLEEELYVDTSRFAQRTAKQMSDSLHRIFTKVIS